MTQSLRADLEAVLGSAYQIERELGQGGMATVFLAQDRKHNRPVAIKVLNPALARYFGPDRFRREIEFAASLSHPHILPLHDSGASGELRWYVMPYVAGESLRHRLTREGPLPVAEATRIARVIAMALDHAHRRGMVHRDVKPENILLADGEPVLADFGIARLVSDADTGSLTQAGVSLGTPGYMSPEQGMGSRELDGRSDVYSLGCVLYEMLTGHQPFMGVTPREILARHALDPVPPVRSGRPSVPDDLQVVIGKALAKEPADRYATAAEMAAALGNVGTGMLTATRAARPAGGSRRRWIGAAIAGVLALALIYAVASRRITVSTSGDGPIRIAVLPLETVGGDDPEYFADGLSEEIANRLTRVKRLAIIARHNLLDYRRTGQTLAEVGRTLGVQYVLHGTVRWASTGGERQFRVTPSLVRVEDGQSVWGEGFEGTMADVFRTQSEISERVTRALEVSLLPTEQAALKQPVTSDIEAYKLYVQGRYFWRTRTADGLRRAAQYFERAIARDPGFARAYSGLADAYVLFIQFGASDLSRSEIYGRARAAAERALALDSTLAEAHASLGEIVMYADWDWAGAEARFRRAIELDPDYATARQWYSELLLVSGRTAGALDQGQLAVSLDPVSPVVGNALAFVLLARHRYPEAAREYRRVLAIDSTFGYAVFGLALTALAEGRADDAIAAMRRAGDRSELTALWMRGAVDPATRPKAVAALLRERETVERWPAEVQAWAWAALHENDRAFVVLERMARERGPTIPGVNSIPLYDPLKSDPRFDALVKTIGWR